MDAVWPAGWAIDPVVIVSLSFLETIEAIR
jgi:hypothetical protein